MKSTDSDHDHDSDHPDMTPMIDVVFQLLIFFLVSMKFKTLDMKIDAFLPLDAGVTVGPIPKPHPTLSARLLRRPGERFTRLKLQNQLVGTLDGPDAARTWARLSEAARKMRSLSAAAGVDPEAVRGEIDASPHVPTGEVVRAVDAFIAGDLRNVTFRGTPKPGSVMDRGR